MNHESDESNESEEVIGAGNRSFLWFFPLPFVRFVRFVVSQLFPKKEMAPDIPAPFPGYGLYRLLEPKQMVEGEIENVRSACSLDNPVFGNNCHPMAIETKVRKIGNSPWDRCFQGGAPDA